MQLKNYQEDIVLHVINIVLEDQLEYKTDITFINDVAAYALNRIPTKYIMSERGFTRLASLHLLHEDNGKGLVNLVELMGLINKGIEVVKERRKPQVNTGPYSYPGAKVPDIKNIEYFHNFPQFIGKVVDQSSRKPVYDACVTMYIDGLTAQPAEPGWINPYHTNNATKGVYSFWPQAIKNNAKSKKSKVKITFAHKDYQPYSIEKEIYIEGVFRVYNSIDGNSIVNLETCFLVH